MHERPDGTPRRVAGAVADELASDGASAVILSGSHARGDAVPDSDLDVYAIGEGAAYRLLRREGFLVSVSWRTPEQVRDAFESPAEAGMTVPGWRQAVILHDPNGIAGELQQEALRWTWDRVGEETCDRWVADEVAGFAEEVHKLVDMLGTGNDSGVAIQRSILALRLARPLAVHHRLLYDTENQLWEMVNETMGDCWRKIQEAALGLNGEPLDVSCQSALELFALACREISTLFDEEQREVVNYACALAGHALPERSGNGNRSG